VQEVAEVHALAVALAAAILAAHCRAIRVDLAVRAGRLEEAEVAASRSHERTPLLSGPAASGVYGITGSRFGASGDVRSSVVEPTALEAPYLEHRLFTH
jgi:hypothetical protein